MLMIEATELKVLLESCDKAYSEAVKATRTWTAAELNGNAAQMEAARAARAARLAHSQALSATIKALRSAISKAEQGAG
jgi:hypothetical protein